MLDRTLYRSTLWLLPVAMLLVAETARADGARVSIDVDKHIAAVGEEVQVTVEISLEGRASYSQYLPPSFAGFRVGAGGMTSRNIEMINFQVRQTESYVYTVTPLREGVLQIGPAAITVGGRRVQSQSVSLRVRKGTGGPVPNAVPEPPSPSGPTEDGVLPSVFLNVNAAPQRVYLGQQLVVTWSLFTQGDVLGFQTTKQPTTDGFWSEDLQSPQRLQFEQRMIRDRVFLAAVLLRKALFPQRVGRLTIGPMEAEVRTLDHFTAGAVARQSEPLTIEVLPLPTKGRPPGFPQSNVGQFEIFGSLDRPSVKAGDAVTLRVVVRGSGNLGQLRLPQLGNLDGIRVYEPKVESRLDVQGGVSGEKILEYLLLPVRGGRLTVPAIALDFFDPQTASYRRVATTPLALTVTGEMPAGATPRGEGKHNVLGPGIRPPRPIAALSGRSTSLFHARPLFWVLLLFPLCALVLISGGERLRARLARETPRSIRRQAERLVSGHLRRAQDLRRGGKPAEFFGEISAALRAQLDHQLGARAEGLTRDELRERMLNYGFPEELIEEVLRELDNCDYARFARSASGDEQMGQTLVSVRQLVNRLARVPASTGAGA